MYIQIYFWLQISKYPCTYNVCGLYLTTGIVRDHRFGSAKEVPYGGSVFVSKHAISNQYHVASKHQTSLEVWLHPPKKILPNGHSQQVWLEDLGYISSSPNSPDFFCWRWFPQFRGGKSEHLFLVEDFYLGIHEAFRMFFFPNQLWIRQKPTIRIQLSGCFFQWIFQVVVKGW